MTDRRWWFESFTVTYGNSPAVVVVEESIPWDDRGPFPHGYRPPYSGPTPFASSSIGVEDAAGWLPLWEEPPRPGPRSRAERKPGSTVTLRGPQPQPTPTD